jgi:hypothetical protein
MRSVIMIYSLMISTSLVANPYTQFAPFKAEKQVAKNTVCPNFTGTWTGVCLQPGAPDVTETMTISQEGCSTMTMSMGGAMSGIILAGQQVDSGSKGGFNYHNSVTSQWDPNAERAVGILVNLARTDNNSLITLTQGTVETSMTDDNTLITKVDLKTKALNEGVEGNWTFQRTCTYQRSTTP